MQVCIFVKSVSRATELDRLLRECNFPSIAIHSGLPQDERIKRYNQFKAFEKRVLVRLSFLLVLCHSLTMHTGLYRHLWSWIGCGATECRFQLRCSGRC